MKKLLEWRKNFMRKNPVLTTYIGFAKGVTLTILVYELIIKK